MKRLFVLCALVSSPAWAEFRQGTTITLSKDTLVTEDLTVVGGTVEINALVEGDLVIAAGDIRINAPVRGDVLLWGGRAVIAAPVSGSVRGVVGQLDLNAPVTEDLFFGGGLATIAPGTTIGRDALAAAGQLDLEGTVGRDVRVGAGQLTIDGTVGGSVKGTTQQLTLGNQAVVRGDVRITSPTEVNRAAGARIDGTLERVASAASEATFGSGVLAFFRRLFVFLVITLFWRVFFPGFSRRATEFLAERPANAFGIGVIAMIITPVVLLAGLAIGALLGGWWLAGVGAAVFALFCAIAIPLVGHVLMRRFAALVKWELGEVTTQLIGVIALTMLMSLPGIGLVVGLAATAFGLGAQAIALPGRIRLTTARRLDDRPETVRIPIAT